MNTSNPHIEILSPGDDLYDSVNEALQVTKNKRKETTVLYNGIAEAYNSAEVEDFLVIDEVNDRRISNLEKVFSNRGLRRYVDYDLYRPTTDKSGEPIRRADRKTLIKRLSMSMMRVV